MSEPAIIGWGIFRKDGTLAKTYYPDCEAACSTMELAQFLAERCRDDYNGEPGNADHQPYTASGICNSADLMTKIEWLTVVPEKGSAVMHWSWEGAVGRIIYSAKRGTALEVVYAPRNHHFKQNAPRGRRTILYKPEFLRPSTPEEIEAAGVKS